MNYFNLMLISGALMAVAASAETIFNADASNVSLVGNNFDPGETNTVTGSSNDLVFTHSGGKFDAAGFASTGDVESLSGQSLASTNAVVLTATISSITGELLSNGIEFGMSPNATGFRPVDNFLFGIKAVGQTCILTGNAFTAGATSAGFGVTEASLYDGFGITLTVTPTHWTFALTDVVLSSGTSASVSGYYTGTQFVDHFSGGHFYITSQKTDSPDLVMTFSEASVAVIPVEEAPPVDIPLPTLCVVSSPDDQTQVEIMELDGLLSYTVTHLGQTLLSDSSLQLFDGGRLRISHTEDTAADTTWESVWGPFRNVKNQFEGVALTLDADSGGDVVLECRVFNDGVGLRFTSGSESLDSVSALNFVSEYDFPDAGKMYWANGEKDPVGPVVVSTFNSGTLTPVVPVVVDAGNGVFASVLESDLFSADGFSTVKFGHANGELVGKSPATIGSADWQSPWRVLLLGQSAGDLQMSTASLNLAAECMLPDTSWIKPGKFMWDFRVFGYKVDGFTYGKTTASYKRFIDFAASNNVQYLLMDGAWYTSVTDGKFVRKSSINLPVIMAYAAARDVSVMLYYDRKSGEYGDELLFPYLSDIGAVGMKYGFMGDNALFTREAIALAAESHLYIDFHDSPCPMTGVERTLPNAMTREYCHAQQDARSAFTPTAFLKFAMINALTGPLDQANGNFGLNGINAGERERGPLPVESYSSTVVSEAARVLVIPNGLICLPDAPEEYEKKDDLFDFIRRMPATWGESRVINSSIGKHITTARRYGNEWFVGSVINEAGGNLAIPLDFLASNIVYDVTYYEDAADTHCDTNREAYQIRQGTVMQHETLTATLAPGGGHCMWIRPQKKFEVTDQGFSLAWTSSEKETYRVERTASLVSNNWVTVKSNAMEGIWVDTSLEAKTAEQFFYRVQMEEK